MLTRRFLVLASLLLFAVLVGVTWGMQNIRQELLAPVGGKEPLVLTVPRGATIKKILEDLKNRGALKQSRWIYLYARAKKWTDVRAGEYEIRPSDSPIEILSMLREGRVKLESFTVPEGLDRWQVRDRLTEEHWMTAATFDRLCNDVSFLKSNKIPGPTCEGYLFPETYTFARAVSPEKIFSKMFETLLRVFDEMTAKSRGPMNLDLRELVTLASIVEKETGDPNERPRIACVFYNRLMAKKKWRLDTDPSVIYAAKLQDPQFDGNLTREHLRKLDSPYNTYRVLGLPPGPIANPGRAALAAVVTPNACNDFFFVSKNNGSHEFCPTLDCHNRAVEKWQVNYFRRAGR